jgi:hypothetical protein
VDPVDPEHLFPDYYKLTSNLNDKFQYYVVTYGMTMIKQGTCIPERLDTTVGSPFYLLYIRVPIAIFGFRLTL